VAYGTTARVCRSAIDEARREGLKAGLLRPITLWPFPKQQLQGLAAKTKYMLAVEMNMGQMVDDVRLAVNGAIPVHFYGRTGGMSPTPKDVLMKIQNILGGEQA
jgi:2-oxoglutarate ferredoxin oxidoreductase subunit alpha